MSFAEVYLLSVFDVLILGGGLGRDEIEQRDISR